MNKQIFDLPGVDPFSVLSEEIERLKNFFHALSEKEWQAPTRCEGWTVRDIVAHLDNVEEYNEACLDYTLDAMLIDFSSLDDFNTMHIRIRSHLSNKEILHRWIARQDRVRKAWERLGLGSKIQTSIGLYPLQAQIWHITSEYATHGDDMDVKVPKDQKFNRIKWRTQFSAFAVQEKQSAPQLELQGGQMVATFKGYQLALSFEDFISAVSARLEIPRDPDKRQVIEALRTLA